MSTIDLGLLRITHLDGHSDSVADVVGDTVHPLIEEAILASASVAAYCVRDAAENPAELFLDPDGDDLPVEWGTEPLEGAEYWTASGEISAEWGSAPLENY
jgi:hypothetical protein